MSEIEKQIARLLKIPGVLNWARQNFPRTDETEKAIQKFADSKITVSLRPIYALCERLALREITYEEAIDKAGRYKSFHRAAAIEILPLFRDYISKNQFEAIADFRGFRTPFPIGRRSDGKTSSIPVKPTFVTIRQGKLHPVFVLGWANSPLTEHQRRLISSVIKLSLLTQQDFLGCDAEIVTFPRFKGHKIRYQGGWLVSAYPDFSADELQAQVERYKVGLTNVLTRLSER